jgi:hypothetical protein
MFSELAIKISADMQEFEKGLSSAKESLQKFGKVTEDLGKSMTKNVTLPIVAVATGIFLLGVKTSQTADRIDKMSQKLGMSRDSFQKYDFILSQSGASIDSMSAGMKTLTKSISDVLSGVDIATDNFKTLGVEVTDVNGKTRNQNDIFDDLVKSFQMMENSVEKTRMAQEIFGRSGTELLPLLNSQAGSLEELEKTFNSLGITMSDDAVNAGVKFTDTLDQLKRALGASVASIGVEFLPLMQTMAQFIIDRVVPFIREFIANVKSLTDQFMQLSPQTQKMIGIFISIAAALGPALVLFGKLIGVFSLLSNPIGLIILAIAGITAAIVYLYETNENFANFVLGVWEKIQIAFETLASVFNAIIKGDIESAFHIFKDNLLSMFINSEKVLYNIGNLFYTFQEIFSNVIGAIKQIIQNVFIPILQKITETFMIIVSAVKPILQDMLAFIGNIFNTIVTFWNENGAQLTQAVLNIVNFIVGLFHFLANTIIGIVQFFLPLVTSLFKVALQLIQDIFSNVLNIVLGIFKVFIGIFTADWRKAWEGVSDIFQGVFNGVVSIFKGIVNGLVSSINFFINAFNNIRIQVPKVKIPFVGEFGGFDLGVPSIPNIPFLAEGGIVTAPTLAMIGEDRNPEMVIPLNKFASLTNNRQTNIYLDGREITRSIAPHMVDVLRSKLGVSY